MTRAALRHVLTVMIGVAGGYLAAKAWAETP